MRISAGKTMAASRPRFKSPPRALATKPTRVGPPEQPTSPARAMKAYMAVPALGRAAAATEKVPGQKMPTEKPHTAQPTRPRMGLWVSEASR